MKIPSLIFIVLVLAITFTYTEFLDIHNAAIFGIFVVWLISLYINTHLKNREARTPKPVYIAN